MGATARRRRTIINNILIIIIIIQHGGHTQADHYSGHQRILSNWTSVISDVGLIGHPSSMLWSIDTCQNKVSADQYHVTILRAQVECSSRSAVFFKFTADQVLVSNWIAGSGPAKTRLDAASTSSSKHLYSSLLSTLLVFRWNTVLKRTFFPAFSAVLIENRLDIIVYGFAREKIVAVY